MSVFDWQAVAKREGRAHDREVARRRALRARVRVAMQWLELPQPDAAGALSKLREALRVDDARHKRKAK